MLSENVENDKDAANVKKYEHYEKQLMHMLKKKE